MSDTAAERAKGSVAPSRFTPGPWEISGVRIENGDITVNAPALRIGIADVHNAASFGDFVNAALKDQTFGETKDAHTQWANARLIASAPDLLAALTRAVACLDEFLEVTSASWRSDVMRADRTEEIAEQCRVALAKAGEP